MGFFICIMPRKSTRSQSIRMSDFSFNFIPTRISRRTRHSQLRMLITLLTNIVEHTHTRQMRLYRDYLIDKTIAPIMKFNTCARGAYDFVLLSVRPSVHPDLRYSLYISYSVKFNGANKIDI